MLAAVFGFWDLVRTRASSAEIRVEGRARGEEPVEHHDDAHTDRDDDRDQPEWDHRRGEAGEDGGDEDRLLHAP